MNTDTIELAVAAAEAVLALGSLGAAHWYRKQWKLRSLDVALHEELAADAQANIEGLRAELAEVNAAAGRWAGKFTAAQLELRRIEREREEAAERRRDHMRRIGLAGNKSEKRRAKPAPMTVN